DEVGRRALEIVLIQSFCVDIAVGDPVVDVADGGFVAPEDIESFSVPAPGVIHDPQVIAIGVGCIGDAVLSYELVVTLIIPFDAKGTTGLYPLVVDEIMHGFLEVRMVP